MTIDSAREKKEQILHYSINFSHNSFSENGYQTLKLKIKFKDN